MTRLLVLVLFLTTNTTLADVKNREKAKLDVISSIEILVNIDECRKGIRENAEASELPRVCNRLPHLAKYFFSPQKDKQAINEYLNNEEHKVSDDALKLVRAWKINKLGKMTLSEKCVKNRDPLDLDLYLSKIRGEPVIFDDDSKEKQVDGLKPEPRNPALDEQEIPAPELIN